MYARFASELSATDAFRPASDALRVTCNAREPAMPSLWPTGGHVRRTRTGDAMRAHDATRVNTLRVGALGGRRPCLRRHAAPEPGVHARTHRVQCTHHWQYTPHAQSAPRAHPRVYTRFCPLMRARALTRRQTGGAMRVTCDARGPATPRVYTRFASELSAADALAPARRARAQRTQARTHHVQCTH